MMETKGNVGEALRKAGYSESIVKNPQTVTQSQGFLSLCDALGLTDDFIVNALQEDISTKKGRRVAELRLASELKQLTRPLNTGDSPILNIVIAESNTSAAHVEAHVIDHAINLTGEQTNDVIAPENKNDAPNEGLVEP